MDLTNVVSGTCWKCTENDHGPDHLEKGVKSIRIFEVTRGMVTKPSPTGMVIKGVVDVLKCKTCGEVVPLDTWRTYQADGRIVVKMEKKKGDR